MDRPNILILKILCVSIFLFSSDFSIGQTRILKVQFQLEGKPLQTVLVGSIGQDRFKTNPSGFGEIVIEDHLVEIPIYLRHYKYEILYPTNLVIPNNESYIIPIHLGEKGKKAGELNILLKKINNKITNLQGKNIDLKSFKNEVTQLFEQQNNSVDQKILLGIQQQVQTLEEIRIANQKKQGLLDLEKNRKVKEGKMQTLNEIGRVYDHYLSRLKDVRDAFKFRGANALDDDNAMSYLKVRVDNYTIAYEDMDKLRKTLIADIGQYWENEIFKLEWRNLLNETLEKTHKQTVLKRNETIIENLNNYNTKGRKYRKGKKPVIKNEIKNFVSELDYQIEFLEKEKERLYQKLMDN